jgi:hypothetical protein
MPIIDPRVDAYIEKSQDFAKPVLAHLRALIHEVCPDVTETLKWSMPSFEYKGMLCGLASFKNHCTFGFWKEALLKEVKFPVKNAMGSFGRITSLKDLPDDATMRSIIKEAVRLNDENIKVPKKKAVKSTDVALPDVLREALARNDAAAENFGNFPPSAQREYIEWITEAKTDATRDKRLATTIEWLTEGKRRNWKYEKC